MFGFPRDGNENDSTVSYLALGEELRLSFGRRLAWGPGIHNFRLKNCLQYILGSLR